MTIRVDISIGPVQGFVSQSRRTRDLWGSSYLLAFLTAHAMRGAAEAGGRIVQPPVEDDRLYMWVSGRGAGDPPPIGTVPNHFTAETDGDPHAVAYAAQDAFDSVWKRVCDAVWGRYVAGAASSGNATQTIWDRQVSSFWDFLWIASPRDDHSLLARRKHWRSHRPPDEPGDKCTVMHDLQELSGFVRAQDRNKQNDFWERVRRGMGALDLQDNERLCAVALVKRLFPRVAKDALGWNVDASRWPSTVYVGAVPWIRRAVKAAPDAVREYAECVGRATSDDVFPMQSPPFEGLRTISAGRFPMLDANYLHREFVRDERLCRLKDRGARSTRSELVDALSVIYEIEDERGKLGSPSKFYALLLADGDRLGKLVSEAGGKVVSEALARFTSKVPGIVEKHDGATIYAGGDDMLAMLPVDKALDCADALAGAYPESFEDHSVRKNATLSVAAMFAQVRLPLRYVLRQAHTLLDDVAKDGNGRSSLVAAVLKPGGTYCQWVTTWTRPTENGKASAVEQIERLKSDLARSDSRERLSSSLLYRVRDTLSMLCGWDRWEPGAWGKKPTEVSLFPFLRAEIYRSLGAQFGNPSGQHADQLTKHVCDLLEQSRNVGADDTDAEQRSPKVGVDGLLLARFLSSPDREDGR